MIEFTMPSLGSDMDEGTLNEWLVKPGDKVTRGQVVAIVETTKAAVEIECWHEGTVGELLVPVGQTVHIDAPLATLLTADEATGTAPRPSSPIPTGETTAAGPPPAAVAPHRRRWVTPAARRLAGTKGVALVALKDTAPPPSLSMR
ncbi:MAG: 2-oxo acid dehydrogenase subunit E2, partial [Mycobacterium sp.]|nr:2-oxo acid dehydrogenase subunit E2 [Mycobacterium sp.]